MSTFTWPIRIASLDGQRSLDFDATVDTGSDFTTMARSSLRELGIEPAGRRSFRLADNRQIERDWGHAWAAIDGESVITLVVFGDDDSPALIGAYTLEGLALAVDPLAGRLVPRQLIMY